VIPRSALWSALVVSAGIALVICYLVASQQLLLGDRQAGWIYPYVAPFTWRAIGVASIVITTAFILLLVLPAPGARNEWFVVSLWILVAVALQGLVRSLPPYSMSEIFSSDGANAFYRVTQVTDPRSMLREFSHNRSDWPLHAQSNMPGKTMLLFALELLSNSPSVLPWLIVALSSAGGALLYLFVRDLFNDRQVALVTLALYLLMPARLFFLPVMNTMTPVVFFACAWLVLRWLQTGNQWYAASAGLAVYVLAFFEPLPLVMGLLLVALIARSVMQRDLAPRRTAIDITAGALGFLAIYLAMRLWLNFDLIEAFRAVAAHAVEFNTTEGRPYGYWVRTNVREFMFGVGICQAILFLLTLVYSLRNASSDASSLATPIALMTSTLAIILLIIDLLGVNRGEVIRLWIFLACFFQIPAAYVCARHASRAAIVIVISMTSLQTAIGAAMIGFVVP
jgi:methylthioxylose transferase